ncbi:MAG: alpha/beta fold hydrolase [Actinobacteria bacterium]|uniref:Unannotated protein n=1 Tax=freshwater metagenome TaxID=449393 RepID=A0A6J5ZSL7_9ZZZZ|nr:alpha/beta fold hydrolase [Actinomycetota bacterium]
MSPIAHGLGVELQYEISGDGLDVLAIHPLGGSGELTAAKLAPLAQRARLISYDRRGYGGSGAPDPYTATTVAEQSDDAAALLESVADGPAVLVGFGFGALIALDLAIRRSELVGGAVLVDPLVYPLDNGGSRELAEQRERLEEALLAGDRPAAAAALVNGDSELGRNAADQLAAALADYGGLASLPITHGALRSCEVPIRVVLSGSESELIDQIAARLAELLGNGEMLGQTDPAAAAESLLD